MKKISIKKETIVAVGVKNGQIVSFNGCRRTNDLAREEAESIPENWPGKIDDIEAAIKSAFGYDEGMAHFFGDEDFRLCGEKQVATNETVEAAAQRFAERLIRFRESFAPPAVLEDGEYQFSV